LRASEAKARAIIDASPVPMALNDDAQNITILNPAFTATFGYVQSDIPTLSDWWPKAYPDPVYRQKIAEVWLAEVSRSAQSGTPFTPMEAIIRCKDGTDRIVLATATPLEDAHRGIYLVMIHDITDRRYAEDEIREQLDELRRWHDLVLGREDRLIELKGEVNALLAAQHLPPRYASEDVP
jgi:PAS domain S-box-containing protein